MAVTWLAASKIDDAGEELQLHLIRGLRLKRYALVLRSLRRAPVFSCSMGKSLG